MEFGIRLLGAFVVTYIASRLLFRLFGARSQASMLPIFGVHLLCFAILAGGVSMLRAYWGTFAWEAAWPYVAPQVVWLILDIARARK